MKTLKYMMMAVMMTIATSAAAMTYNQAKQEALFLADKMAYELSLTEAQYEAAYEINLDYLMAVNDHRDVFGTYWTRRNIDMSTILAAWQYNLYAAADYFYRPVYWADNTWRWRIYSHYDRDRFYRTQPKVYISYRGGHNSKYYTSRSWNKPAVPVNNATAKSNNSWRSNKTSKVHEQNNYNARNNNASNSNRSFGNMQKSVNNNNINFGQSTNNRSFGQSSTSAVMAKANTSTGYSGSSHFGGHR